MHTTSQVLDIDDTLLAENISIYKTNLRIVGIQNGTADLVLFDILWKKLVSKKFVANGVHDISLPNLKAGIYLVRIQTKKGKITKKIVLEQPVVYVDF